MSVIMLLGNSTLKRSSEDRNVNSSFPFWFSSLLQKKACAGCFLERWKHTPMPLTVSLETFCFNPSFMCLSVVSCPSNQEEHVEGFSPPEGQMVLVNLVQFCVFCLLFPKFSV